MKGTHVILYGGHISYHKEDTNYIIRRIHITRRTHISKHNCRFQDGDLLNFVSSGRLRAKDLPNDRTGTNYRRHRKRVTS